MGITSQPHYTSFDQCPPAQRKRQLWDPISTLDIINPDRGGLTCVAYAPSCRRRCRNPINQDNRDFAFKLLNRLSYINVSTTDIKPELYQLAGFTLCLRNHKNQKHGMVEQWCRKINQTQQTGEQRDDLADLVARLLKQNRELKDFISSSPEFLRYRNQYDRRSAQEEQEQELREEETRKARERERYQQQSAREEQARKLREEEARKSRERQQSQQQQERREREHKEREDNARAERNAKKRAEEREQKKREEEEERKKREEEKRCKEEQQAKDREAREREERNERIRQRAEQARKERERKAAEQAVKERKEWDDAWIQYGLRWDTLKKNGARGTSEQLRETIPWPVKSLDCRDVSESAVEEFYQKAPPQTNGTERMFDIMKMECLKWHADRIPRMFGTIVDSDLAALFTTVAQVAIKVRAETVRKRER